MKTLEELTLRDDFMFGKVFEDTDLARELIDRILPELKIKELNPVIKQMALDDVYDAHGIRFDIYTENDEYLFGVEIHNDSTTFSAKRMRYYQAAADFHQLEKGITYDSMKNVYIIVICTYDPFEDGRMVYRYERVCRDTQKPLNDGSWCVYINCTSMEEGFPDLRPFCRYTMTGEAQDDFTERVNRAVEKGKKNKDWKRDFMNLQMRLYDERKKGREEGRNAVVRELVLRKLDKGFSAEEIADLDGIPLEEVHRIAAEKA